MCAPPLNLGEAKVRAHHEAYGARGLAAAIHVRALFRSVSHCPQLPRGCPQEPASKRVAWPIRQHAGLR
jgi:hypothetical protein